MRVFGYYAWHSFVNQIRKLFKTWILVFVLVCGLMGGIVGLTIGSLESSSDEYAAEEMESIDEDETDPGDDAYEETEQENTPLISTNAFDITWEEEGLAVVYTDGTSAVFGFGQILELICTLVIAAFLIYYILSADKNGSKIFLPADVNLLFAAPMKPQSALMFRLMCQVGVSVFASVYLLFQIPTLSDMGLSLPVILSVFAAWTFLLIICMLLQVFFYTLCSTKIRLKKYLTPGVWGCLVLLLAAVFLYGTVSGKHSIPAAVDAFTAPVTRWLPFIGWLKGLVLFLYEGQYFKGLLCLLLLLAGTILLTFGIWHMKADFYEDAMVKSEELAALMASAEEKGSLVAFKKKDRSEKLRKNELNRGRGANVFFYKSLYNRRRFAPGGILTKTAITYLGAALAGFLLGKLLESEQPFTVLVFLIGALVFFRSLGNPLVEDTRMPFFSIIPENTWLKLFWSVLAGTVNCLLDLLPAMILGAVLTGVNPVLLPGYLALILSVDAYATIVGTFIALSVPESIGKLPKQLVQVLFVYFGLVPDILCIVAGYFSGHPVIGMLGAASVNLLLGAVFFILTPLFLEPKAGARPWAAPLSEENRKKAGKAFRRIGTASFLLLASASALQILLGRLVPSIWPEAAESSAAVYLQTFLPIYIVAFPMGFLLLRRMHTEKPADQRLTVPGGIRYVIYSITAMYLGNLLGVLVNQLIGLFLPSADSSAVTDLILQSDGVLLRILFMVLAAPIMEELFFRKFLIDRMRPYGEKTAMITSALMFGLFHGNFSQFFYATALGIVFAYVYLHTGRIRYTIALHMGINLWGSVISVWLLEKITGNLTDLMSAELSEINLSIWVYIYIAYAVALIIIAIIGILLLCVRAEKITYQDVSRELARGQIIKTVWGNIGMILFFLGCAALFVFQYLG
ncbi:MAG: putative ABC exporter domain-containing protein [Lachnospiraceae bacterium]|nr:putative ABC exporter domain-containing protein [Lachnospiraceae bacterium]